MQATRVIRDAREVARMERRLQEGGHSIVHRWSPKLHEVIYQRIAAATIHMQEPAREIESSCGKRLACLPFEDGIGVVKDGVGGIIGTLSHATFSRGI
jgi:hypothetical protein